MSFQYRLLLCVFLVACFSGCNKNPNATIPVTGTVLVDGKPMEGVSVMFFPASEGKSASGNTDAQGNFTLSTPLSPEGTGAVAGEYKVAFSKSEALPDTRSFSKDSDELVPKAEVRYLVAPKFGNPDTSGITPVKVVAGEKNHFEFKITSK